jgi:hypothetical protein
MPQLLRLAHLIARISGLGLDGVGLPEMIDFSGFFFFSAGAGAMILFQKKRFWNSALNQNFIAGQDTH